MVGFGQRVPRIWCSTWAATAPTQTQIRRLCPSPFLVSVSVDVAFAVANLVAVGIRPSRTSFPTIKGPIAESTCHSFSSSCAWRFFINPRNIATFAENFCTLLSDESPKTRGGNEGDRSGTQVAAGDGDEDDIGKGNVNGDGMTTHGNGDEHARSPLRRGPSPTSRGGSRSPV
jgi:hypothetical protein